MVRRPVQRPEGSDIQNMEPRVSQNDMSDVTINHLQESGDEDRESSDTKVADQQANGDEDSETSNTEVTDEQTDGDEANGDEDSETSDTEVADEQADGDEDSDTSDNEVADNPHVPDGVRKKQQEIQYLMNLYQDKIEQERNRFHPSNFAPGDFHKGQYMKYKLMCCDGWWQGVIGKIEEIDYLGGTCEITLLNMGLSEPGSTEVIDFPMDLEEIQIVQVSWSFEFAYVQRSPKLKKLLKNLPSVRKIFTGDTDEQLHRDKLRNRH